MVVKRIKQNVCITVCVCICICIYIYIYSGLEIGGFASPNANYVWGKCESLWPTDLLCFWFTANQIRPIANHLF